MVFPKWAHLMICLSTPSGCQDMTRRSWPLRKFVWETWSKWTPDFNLRRIFPVVWWSDWRKNWLHDPMRPDFWFINFLPFLESFKMKFEKMCSKLTPPVPLNQGRVQTGPDGAGYLEPSLSKTGGSKNALNCSSRVGWTSKKILRISWKHAPYFIISLV